MTLEEFYFDMIVRAIEDIYDDPSGYTVDELGKLLGIYKAAASKHGVVFDQVVSSRTDFEIERMNKRLKDYKSQALPVATTKIVYNACFGGFSVSHAAIMRYAEIKGIKLYVENDSGYKTYWTVPPEDRTRKNATKIQDNFHKHSDEQRRWSNAKHEELTLNVRDFSRTDPVLVQVVEELGSAAGGQFAELAIRELPVGTRYRIDEYDGNESVVTLDEHEWQTA